MLLDNSIATAQLANAKLAQLNKKELSADEKKLKEQTDGFEAIIIKQLLDESMDSKNPLFPKQPGEEIYHSMFTDQLSHQLTGNFGFSQLLFNYLKENPTIKKEPA